MNKTFAPRYYGRTTNPLILRGGIDKRVTLFGRVAVTHVNHVRLQGFHLTHTNAAVPAVTFDGVEGAALASCIVLAPVLFTNSPSARVIGNTLDGNVANGSITLTDATNALIRNNIYLNNGTDAGVAWNSTPDSDYNCYWPSNSLLPSEANSLYVAPGVTANGLYEIVDFNSPVRGVGEYQVGFDADVRGWYRHLFEPSIGAVEYGWEKRYTFDASGCVTERYVAGRLYEYAYDARGQLTAYTDISAPQNNAVYTYDHLGNRILMTVGSGSQAVTTRFVYQGQDVIAEYETDPGGTNIVRKRVYWILPELDQRIGFVEIAGGNRTVYYYLTDQVGSVQRIVRADGAVVNQYDYDAFGNIRWENSFEGVPNRYTFQGREWDAHAGHYHYRNRTYIPEWGSFTGPDMNLERGILGEHNGMGGYLFCDNNPLVWVDPEGLDYLRLVGTLQKDAEGFWTAQAWTFEWVDELGPVGFMHDYAMTIPGNLVIDKSGKVTVAFLDQPVRGQAFTIAELIDVLTRARPTSGPVFPEDPTEDDNPLQQALNRRGRRIGPGLSGITSDAAVGSWGRLTFEAQMSAVGGRLGIARRRWKAYSKWPSAADITKELASIVAQFAVRSTPLGATGAGVIALGKVGHDFAEAEKQERKYSTTTEFDDLATPRVYYEPDWRRQKRNLRRWYPEMRIDKATSDEIRFHYILYNDRK